MKLGVGVITTPRRRHLWTEEDLKLTEGTLLHVHNDTEFKGASFGRNECIKALYDQGCSYIAVCDDDLDYHTKGWLEHTVRVMGENCMPFCCLPNIFEGRRMDFNGTMEYWPEYIGAFYVLSRMTVEEVGYFSTEFKGYGFEDVHYRHRLQRAYGHVGNPKILPYLVTSQDVMGTQQTLSRDDKQQKIDENRPIFERLTQNGRIYYPYTDGQ